MKGRQLDLSSEAPAPPGTGEAAAEQRSFLGVRFDCCGIYARVYKNAAGDAYEGRCPKCAQPVRFDVGPGGTSSRFFSVS